jgi:hypothetical protein
MLHHVLQDDDGEGGCHCNRSCYSSHDIMVQCREGQRPLVLRRQLERCKKELSVGKQWKRSRCGRGVLKRSADRQMLSNSYQQFDVLSHCDYPLALTDVYITATTFHTSLTITPSTSHWSLDSSTTQSSNDSSISTPTSHVERSQESQQQNQSVVRKLQRWRRKKQATVMAAPQPSW